MVPRTKIALFGGSFNPCHMAHVFATCYLSTMNFDQILVTPVFDHPFSKKLEKYIHRFEMCHLAMGWIPKVLISSNELNVSSNGEASYTINNVRRIKESLDCDIHLVVGSDAARDLEAGLWAESEELLSLTNLFVFGRGDLDKFSILPDISSTQIRESLNGDSKLAESYLPVNVLNYIIYHQLYRKENDNNKLQASTRQGVD